MDWRKWLSWREDAEFSAGFYGEQFARFDELGEDSVRRLLFSGGIAPKTERPRSYGWGSSRGGLTLERTLRS